LSDPPSSPEETPSREERIQRIIADYRAALRGQQAPSVDAVVAENADLDSTLLRQLLKAEARAESNDASTEPFLGEATEEWTPNTTSASSTTPIRSGNVGLSLGSRVGQYRLLSELGRGGMGVVYKAEHMPSERLLALKILSPDIPHTEKTVERFLNEASLAAALSHPRTTFVYEAGDCEGRLFISMELMPGRTLRDVVQSEGALPVSRAVDYILDVLDGLEAAHQAGVVHRDVKPSNCFLDEQGRVKVGDFGLSKSLVATKDLTLTGTFLGTPQYAAPEQFGRGEIDHRTDIFAVAGTLYYLIAGEAPFTGDAAAVIAQIVADDPPPLHSVKSDVPRALSRILRRALSKGPTDRYQSVAELRSALMPYSTGGSTMADVGRRVAAFFIDILLVSIVVSVAASVFIVARYGVSAGADAVRDYFWVSSTIWLLYFAVSEGVFSRSLGKTWLSLRVVDEYGEPPGFLRAVLRAIVVPGLSWVTVDAAQWYYHQQLTADIQQQMRGGIQLAHPAWAYFVIPQVFTLARGLLCLVVCSSMRSRNGYRGLHEFLSGTRVIRHHGHESADDVRTVPNYAFIAAEDLPETIGSFRLVGRVGMSGNTQVLAARDDQLDRPVWIYQDTEGLPLSAERKRLARATRQRWLTEGTAEDSSDWQAFEALSGAPLSEVSRYAHLPWEIACQIWSQTAEELQAALADHTLPEPLSVEQLWVDQRGTLKLSDFPLDQCGRARISETESADVRAMKLLCDVAQTCTDDDETPAEALDLMHELRRGGSSESGLIESTSQSLRDIMGRPYRLRWDDRLGIVAISAGLETALICPAALIASSFMANYGTSMVLSVAPAIIIGLAVVALVTYVTSGGPAFRLTKTSIRNNRSKRPATKLRASLRNLIAWLPIVTFHSILGPFTIASLQGVTEFGMAFALMGIFLVTQVFIQLVGILYAIVRPRRGLQDLLAGTCLVRRTGEGGLS
jgi:uncharacterized RDD family membrane protein YckC